MLKKFINFLLLSCLLTKLLINLGFFSAQYALLKIKEKRELTPLLLFVLLIIGLINWQLWQRRKTPKIQLKTAPSQNPGEIFFSLEKEELGKLKEFYLELETKQKHNRDILFNLGKLLELEDLSLAQEKFEQSWDLDPNYSWKNQL